MHPMWGQVLKSVMIYTKEERDSSSETEADAGLTDVRVPRRTPWGQNTSPKDQRGAGVTGGENSGRGKVRSLFDQRTGPVLLGKQEPYDSELGRESQMARWPAQHLGPTKGSSKIEMSSCRRKGDLTCSHPGVRGGSPGRPWAQKLFPGVTRAARRRGVQQTQGCL